jgi:uncharacterized protein
MEKFFQSHSFMLNHLNAPVQRSLMDKIDWSHRMIGIRGPRGVGKTTFLLQYARDHFDPQFKQCLYISMNNFYFQGRGIVEFAEDFVKYGGRVLLIDQVFKQPNYAEELVECYRRFDKLHIVYSVSSVMPPDNEAQRELNRISDVYVLHGFSFREFVNSQTGLNFRPYSLNEILESHEQILKTILPKVRPWNYFQDYLHHGYYPFFLETHNFTEQLLKSINMMIEVDILFIKQIDLKYLARIKKLFYLLGMEGITSPNVTKLANEIGTSRATVMNYIKDLEEARLVNLVYHEGEEFPKKPVQIMIHNTNLLYAISSRSADEQEVMETFFTNSVWRHHSVSKGKRNGAYYIDGHLINVCDKSRRFKGQDDVYYARYNSEVGHGNDIPLWLFGFLY